MPDPRDDGGPAFPYPGMETRGAIYTGHTGMSLRDYFAGQILTSIALREDQLTGDFSKFCDACYRVADTMLEARKR